MTTDLTQSRIIGLDLARFIAVIGMIATHVWLYADLSTGEQRWFSTQFQGRASALFAVLAGVGIILSTRSQLAHGRLWPARRMLIGRGIALAAIGLTLGLLRPPMLIILVSYGLMFCLLTFALTLPRRMLLALSVTVGLSSPILTFLVSTWSRTGNVTEIDNPSWLDLAQPVRLLQSLLFTGQYPVAIWLAYGLSGMVVGLSLVRAGSLTELRKAGRNVTVAGAGIWALGLIAAGIVHSALDPVYTVVIDDSRIGRPLRGSWTYLLGAGPHNGTSLDLLLTIGFAVTTIGSLTLLGTTLGSTARRVLAPILGAGRAPLTVYSAHVVLVGCAVIFVSGKAYGALTGQDLRAISATWWISSTEFFVANVFLVLTIGALVVWLRRRGPLETFVTWAGRTAARLGRPKIAAQPDQTEHE